MSSGGERKQVLVDASELVKSGRTRVYNVTNGGTQATVTLYDNTAASGTKVFELLMEPGASIDIPGGLLCKTGCFGVPSAGGFSVTI